MGKGRKVYYFLGQSQSSTLYRIWNKKNASNNLINKIAYMKSWWYDIEECLCCLALYFQRM
jgi:hypothetical protein